MPPPYFVEIARFEAKRTGGLRPEASGPDREGGNAAKSSYVGAEAIASIRLQAPLDGAGSLPELSCRHLTAQEPRR